MKVNNDSNKILQGLNTAKASELDKKSKVDGKQTKETASQSAKDLSAKVDLSQRAQEMKKMKDIAMKSPDVDHAKVKKFQELIDKGAYKVDAKSVADRMVDESLMNSLAEEG